MTSRDFLDVLEEIITKTVEPAAPTIDLTAKFPRATVTEMGRAGLLGLLSSTDVGGMGGSLADAALVVRRLAASCASSAMVIAMHYSGTAAIEAHGPDDVRREIAEGHHLTTLAFSETGSRSQFWAPLGTATSSDDGVVLNASKSWVTSAGEANSYVWTSRPVADSDGATLWLVPADTAGLTIGAPFDGLGLRGNASRSISADHVTIPESDRLGDDGAGLDIAFATVLPVFLILNASCSLGLMDAGLTATIAHAMKARFEHLDQTLAQQPVTRQHIAGMQNWADAANSLVDDAVAALAAGRPDAPLRMLQSKAVAGESALTVLDTAMRVGGGAAFRKEVGIERHFRDARAAAVMAPTTDALRDFIGRAVCGMDLFG